MSTNPRASRAIGLLAPAVVALVLAVVVNASQQPAAPASGQPAQAPAPGQATAKPEATGPTGFTTSPTLKFRGQDIATDFGVGYAVASGDVNGDKLMDVLAISG